MGKSIRKIPTYSEVMEEKPRKVPSFDEVMGTPAPKMKGEVVFDGPVQEEPQEDIISLSKRAEDLGKKTIDVGITGGVGGGTVKQKDFEAEKEASRLRKIAKDQGYNTAELATDFEDFPQIELDKPGKREELLSLKKSNPIEYKMKLNATKNQYDVLESVKNNIYNSLPEDTPNREFKASQAGIHAANEYNDLNIQDGDSLNDKYGKILGKLTIINENVPAEQRSKMISRLQDDAAQHITGTSKQLKEELANSEWNGKLDANQYAGLKTLQIFQPDKYNQAVRLLGVKAPDKQDPYLDPDLDPNDAGEAYAYVEAKKEEAFNKAKGAEAIQKELSDIGRANSIKSIHRKQYNLDRAYKYANEDQKPLLQEQYLQYEGVLKNLQEDAKKDDERYPLLAQMKFDEQVKEIMQDPGFSAVGYGAKKFNKGFKNSFNSLENILTNTFGSKEAKDQLELERLGGGKTDQNEFYLPESYRSTGSQIVPKFSKELSDEVKAIYNDDSLSLGEREKKAREFVAANQDKTDWITNPDAGKSRNFFSKATAYGNAGMIGDVASVAAQTLGLGGAGVGRLLSAAIPMFTSTQNDFYQQAVAEGNPNPMSYANTHAGIMALAGLVNPDIKILRNAIGAGTPAGKFIAGISDETWNAIVEKNPQLLTKFANAAKSVGKEGAKLATIYGAGTSIANDLADKMLGGKNISPDEIIDHAVEATKHTALNSIAMLGLGAVRNFKTASPIEKANIWEAGSNPDVTIRQLEEAATRGDITPEQAKTYTQAAKEISKLIEEVPTQNAKGKPLTDKQRIDYLYNKIIAGKVKELKQGATEGKTEELDTIESQANGDNNKIVSGYPRKTPSQESVEAKEKDAKLFVEELKEGEIINDIEYAAAKDNPMQYFETVAQQANNVTADKVFDTTTDAREAAKAKYGDSVIEYANELFPEYKKIASQKPRVTVSTPDIVNVKLKNNSLNDFGGIKVNVPSMLDFVKRFISDEGISEIKSANVSDLVKIKKMQENAPQEEGVESVSTIGTEGLKEPLVLIKDKDGNMRLQQGHHRLEEAIKLGATKLPVVVVEAPKQRVGEKDVETGEVMGDKLSNAMPIKLENFKPDEADKAGIKGDQPAQTGEETAIPPKPTETTEGQGEVPPIIETPKASRIYVERPATELSHKGLQDVANEFSLPDVKTRDRKSDLNLRKEADLTAQEWAEKGQYALNVERLTKKAEEGDILTDKERVILEQRLANVSDELRNISKTSLEFDAKLSEIKRLKDAGEKTRSEAGAALRLPTILSRPKDLADFMVEEMEASKVEKLTDEQKATVEKEFNNISKAEQAYKDKIAKLEADNARLLAEQAVKKAAAKTKKPKKTHEDFVAERKDILASMKEKLRQSRGDATATILPYAKELIAISPDVAKLVKSLVEEGVTKLADVVKEVHSQVKEIVPEATEQDAWDLVAGKYAQKKESPKLDKEANKLLDNWLQFKKERQLRLLKEEYKNSSNWNKIKTGAVNVLGVPRTLMASMDYSAPLRQALVPTVSHPIMASKAAVEMFKSSFSQKNYDRWFYQLENSDRFPLIKESGLAITDVNNPKLEAKEEQFMNGLAEKIPFVGKLIKGSERAYTIYLNKMRVDLFNRLADEMQKNGRTFANSSGQYKEMAAFVNNMTGRGDLGETLNRAAPVLNQLFFSPRLMASRVNTLTYLTQPRFYKKVPPEVRRDFFKSLATTAGVGLTILGLAKMAGADTEDDPRSPDFGKIKSGKTRWDIWGGHQQYIRLAAQLITGQRKSSTTGEISSLEGDGAFGTTKGDVALGFMRGKLAPVPSMLMDIGSGRTATGDKLTTDWGSDPAHKEIGLGEYLANHLLPLTATGLNDAIKDQGQKAWFTVGVPSIFGVGSQTYTNTNTTAKKPKPKTTKKKKKN